MSLPTTWARRTSVPSRKSCATSGEWIGVRGKDAGCRPGRRDAARMVQDFRLGTLARAIGGAARQALVAKGAAANLAGIVAQREVDTLEASRQLVANQPIFQKGE